MALTDESNGFYMPVAPAYNGGGMGGFGNGGDGWWVLLLLLALGGGWGNGFGGGGFGFGGGYDFPWLFSGQQGINNNVSSGFRDAQLQDSITSVRDGISGLSTQLCNGFSGVNANISNTAAQAEIAANGRQMANMQSIFNVQSALQNCCCENRANIADLKYTVATENCADRQAVSDGIRDVLAATQAQTQAILDRICQDKIDAKNDTISQLRQELLYARGQASQVSQTAQITDNVYDRLSSCPVGTVPVFGNQPIWTCASNVANNNCGCGCGVM